MDTMILKHPVKGIKPLYSQCEPNSIQSDPNHELSVIFAQGLDDPSRDRELKAYTDRIRLLESELQKARSDAYQTGYQEGQNITKTEARKQMSRMTREFNANITVLREEFDTTLERLSDPLLKLALGVAEKLIQHELSINDQAQDVLLTQIQRILAETVTQTQAIIQVNPSQFEWISSAEVIKTLNVAHKGDLRFIPNQHLKPGECKLETEDYLVDSTITAQLENLHKVLKENHAASLT